MRGALITIYKPCVFCNARKHYVVTDDSGKACLPVVCEEGLLTNVFVEIGSARYVSYGEREDPRFMDCVPVNIQMNALVNMALSPSSVRVILTCDKKVDSP